MNRDDFSKLCEEFFEEQRQTLLSKGKEYSKDGDVLENFKRTASDYGVTVPQSWGSHFDKHVSAIRNFCKSGQWINEPIRERIKDAANYLLLLLAHIAETETSTECADGPVTVEMDCGETYGKVEKGMPIF